MQQSIHQSVVRGFRLVERWYSHDEDKISIGLANISAEVPEIEANKDKIICAVRIFKQKKVNMVIFPEFCLTGYFWEDETACREYMDQGVTDNHLDWLRESLAPLIADGLEYVILNNIRRNPQGDRKYLNTTCVIRPGFDLADPQMTYNKIFLPGIENIYSISGRDDRLILETKWGRFGFATCYDLCFPRLLEECALFDRADAVIGIASWRGSGERNYPLSNVRTDHYYGCLWDIMMPALAAANQVWLIASNAVGVHSVSKAKFWGGSGIWAPSGLKLVQGSHQDEELIIMHNVDIIGEKKFEQDDFDYSADLRKVYGPIADRRTFTRV